jgi:tRNA pseudouridine13 synthase
VKSPEASGVDPARPRVYATGDIAGVGGVIKQRPEDFLVEEQPLYQPTGSGEHLYMLVQKRGMSTLDMVGVVARHFGVKRSAVGYAGLKDKHAITRQVVSVHVPGRRPEDFPSLEHERIGVLWVDMHANKLRPGHLRGNRFSVRIRGVDPRAALTANRVLERLRVTGVPNRFGEQRFGLLGNNHVVGRCLAKGDYDGAAWALLGPSEEHPQQHPRARALFAEGKYREAIQAYPFGARTEMMVLKHLAEGQDAQGAFRRLEETLVRYYLSAFQSAVFNAVLDARVRAGTFATLAEGDLAFKHDNGAVFAVDAATLADPDTAARAERLEISPSGPMWGEKMTRAQGEIGRLEEEALAAQGVSVEDLSRGDARSRLEGKRRALRVPLIDPEVEGGVDEHGGYVRCAFELPRGSFATVVLREIMKPPVDLGDEE